MARLGAVIAFMKGFSIATCVGLLFLAGCGGASSSSGSLVPSEKIAFISHRDGNTAEIYVMNADGSNQTRLTNNAFTDSLPAFRPDGQKIVFFSDRTGNDQIFTMNPDGSSVTQLTNNALENAQPSYSPDGRTIVFSANRDVPVDTDQDIYRMDANGANVTDLSNHPGSDEGFPRFSPDGSKIVYEQITGGQAQIYEMNADGSNQVRLTNDAANDALPSFSPDGKKIVFDSDRDGNEQIYIMDANGANQTRITHDNDTDAFPEFSPFGPQIVFNSDRTGNVDIFTMNVDGTHQTQLTNNPAEDAFPSWVP